MHNEMTAKACDDTYSSYYRKLRPEILRYFENASGKILDIGCGEGLTGSLLKRRTTIEVVGIEISQEAANKAKSVLDRVICGDVEQLAFPEHALEKGSFDHIICADVLEHMVDPWRTLASIGQLLKPDGTLIASIPNVRHWSVLLPLLFKGKWDYQVEGILDRTHLRFFTRRSIIKMFAAANLHARECLPLTRRSVDAIATKASLRLMSEFFAVQWLVIAGQYHKG